MVQIFYKGFFQLTDVNKNDPCSVTAANQLTWHPSGTSCGWVKLHQPKLVLCAVLLRLQSET